MTPGEVMHSNDLVARQYLMSFEYDCVNFIDMNMNVETGRPIKAFEFMLLPMQDLMEGRFSDAEYFPNLR